MSDDNFKKNKTPDDAEAENKYRDLIDKLKDSIKNNETLSENERQRMADLLDKRTVLEEQQKHVNEQEQENEIESGQDQGQDLVDDTEHEQQLNNESAYASENKLVLPDNINKKYIEINGKFFFESNPDALAFTDNGKKLKTKLESTKVASDMVDVATAKGWSEVRAKGSDTFRREVWVEASARGITVTGYKPRDEDRALLEKRLKERGENEIEADRVADKAATKSGTTTKEQVVEDDSKTPAQLRAEAIRAKSPHELANDSPELANEAATLKLAERMSMKLPVSERDRFVSLVRGRLASNAEKGIQAAPVAVKETREIRQVNEQEASR